MSADQEGRWTIAAGEEDGHPLLFRIRQGLPDGVLKMQYPKLISVYWPYEGDLQDEDNDVNDQHTAFEETVAPLDSRDLSFLMLVITGGGRKEWHYYTQDESKWVDSLNELLVDSPDYPLEIEVAPDPEWNLYEDVMQGISGLE